MTLLNSHPWLHSLLVLLVTGVFIGISFADGVIQVCYNVKIDRASHRTEVEVQLKKMQTARGLLSVVLLAAICGLLALLNHFPAGM